MTTIGLGPVAEVFEWRGRPPWPKKWVGRACLAADLRPCYCPACGRHYTTQILRDERVPHVKHRLCSDCDHPALGCEAEGGECDGPVLHYERSTEPGEWSSTCLCDAHELAHVEKYGEESIREQPFMRERNRRARRAWDFNKEST